MSNSIQNIAIIGTGMVAKTHLMAINDLKQKLNLVGIMGRDSEKTKSFIDQATQLLGKPIKQYNDIDDLASDKTLDFVIVLTPPNARMEITQKLAQNGISILMEKPIERDVQAATQIVEICEKNGVKLGIVFQHRVRDVSQKLASLIKGGTLGDLYIADVVVPWWRDQSYYNEPGRGTYERDGGGVLISQAIHSLDLMLSLTGNVSSVQAMARTSKFHKMESEDYVSAGLEFENGAIGSLLATTASYPGDAESITLHFQKAVAKLQAGVLSLHWLAGDTEKFGADGASGGGADPMAFTHDWHKDVIEDFADSLTKNKEPIASGRKALEVHRLIDAIVTSSKQNRAISLPKRV